MSEMDGEPLFVGDIVGVDQNNAAIEKDITDKLDGMSPAGQHMIQKAEEFASFIQGFGLGILRRLQVMGVDDAELIAVKLETLDVSAHTTDISTIGTLLDEERMKTDDPVEQRQLKTRACLANVVAGIATTQALRTFDGVESQYGQNLLDHTEEEVDTGDFTDKTRASLRVFIEELKSDFF
jgi:hypothetical protein